MKKHTRYAIILISTLLLCPLAPAMETNKTNQNNSNDNNAITPYESFLPELNGKKSIGLMPVLQQYLNLDNPANSVLGKKIQNLGTYFSVIADVKASVLNFSHDGKLLACKFDNIIKILDASNSSLIATLTNLASFALSFAFSHDDKKLACGLNNGTIEIWDLTEYSCALTVKSHTSSVDSIAFSPSDNNTVYSGCLDGTIEIWDLSNQSCTTRLQGHTKCVKSLAFSQNGKRLASGSDDGTIKIWDLANNSCIATLKGHTSLTTSSGELVHADHVNTVTFFPNDDTKIASGSSDETIKIWDLTNNSCIATLVGHTREVLWNGTVNSIVISPDGDWLASGSNDSTIKIWNLSKVFSPAGKKWDSYNYHEKLNRSKEFCTTLYRNYGPVPSIAFNKDGTKLVSSSFMSDIKIWKIGFITKIDKLLKELCSGTIGVKKFFVLNKILSDLKNKVLKKYSNKTIDLLKEEPWLHELLKIESEVLAIGEKYKNN